MNLAVVRFLSVALLLILTRGIDTAQQIACNYMPGIDFSKYHTCKWVHIPSNAHPNQCVAQEIRESVNSDLAAEGFTLASDERVYVGYRCSVDQEREWSDWGMGGGLRWVRGMGSATSSTISNGVLAVVFS